MYADKILKDVDVSAIENVSIALDEARWFIQNSIEL